MDISLRREGAAAAKTDREASHSRPMRDSLLDAALVSELSTSLSDDPGIVDLYPSMNFKEDLKSDDLNSLETDLCLQEQVHHKLVFVVTRMYHPIPYVEVAPRAVAAALRRRDLARCPVKKFSRSGKMIKHEFFVIKIIRRFVKSLELTILDRPETMSGVMAVLVENSAARASLEAFRKFVDNNKEFLHDYIKPEYMPETDRKAKRKGPSSFSSFNKQFVRSYLKLSPYLRIAYYYFCEVIFQAEPSVLKAAWRMECCQLDLHTGECRDLWSRLKTYAQIEMLEELNISAFTPN